MTVNEYRSVWLLVFGLVLINCGSAEGPTTTDITTFSPTTTPIPEPTFASSTGTPDDPSPGSGTATTTGTDNTTLTGHPDTSSILPDFGGDGLGCGGKIDFLFVLDRFIGSEQEWARMDAALTEVRPKFVEWFANFDTHWMVVDGEQFWGLECDEYCAATNGLTCQPHGPPDYPCAPHTDGSITECDNIRGAGLTFPAGYGSSNKRCELAGGERYIQSSMEPDLLDALACITTVGFSDTPTSAEWEMVEALKPTQTKVPGGCNLGFLRDDALLVVVFFTRYSATDNSNAGEPSEWAAALYDAKFGEQDKVAVIGIVTDRSSQEPTVCPKVGSGYSSDVEEFLHFHIKHFVHGSICANDYTPFFFEGIEMALELCGAEVPT